MNLSFHVIFVLLLFLCLNAYKILVVFPMPGRSMNILGHAIVGHLLNAGHEITYITVHPIENISNKNLHQIHISENLQLFKGQDLVNIGYYMKNDISNQRYKLIQELGITVAKMTLNNDKVKLLLIKREVLFDAVIADLFETEIYSGLSALYDCPMIWSYSMSVHWFALRLIDDSPNPAYSIDYYSYNIPPLNFLQRFRELLSRLQWSFIRWYFIAQEEEKLYYKIFGPLLKTRGKIIPEYNVIKYNSSFIFSNDYVTSVTPNTPQNFKLVGGYHIENPAKPLPPDLEEIFKKSKHGVIYFSMGSTWQSKDFSNKQIEELLEMFGGLNQTVLWKYEEHLQRTPNNVHIAMWVPQQSVLAHPKCKVFITHGGQLSTIEAITFGVPVIGVPINYDQITNAQKAVKIGYGLKVDLDFDLHINLKLALHELLSDQKYTTKAKEMSVVFHDRPIPPGDEIVHWVNHVIKTNGAPHLRSPALMVSWYQKIYLDLAIIVCLILILMVLILNIIHKSLKKIINLREPREDRKQK